MRFNRYLLVEKTFNIKKDVDIIYKKLFTDFMAELAREKILGKNMKTFPK